MQLVISRERFLAAEAAVQALPIEAGAGASAAAAAVAAAGGGGSGMQLEGDEEAAAAAQLASVVAFNTQRRGLVEGRWSAEEHLRFVEGVAEPGTTWQGVQRRVPGRSVTQVRTHAQKYIAKHGKGLALLGLGRDPDGPLAEAGALARLQLQRQSQAAARSTAQGGGGGGGGGGEVSSTRPHGGGQGVPMRPQASHAVAR
jgi:SHAQKYF class myb-like DNA-binding protein